MKLLAIMGILFLGIAAVLFTDIGSMLVMFILVGHIPFTKLSVPPLAMLLLWVLIVPVTINLYRIGNYSIWRGIEKIGEISQRRINHNLRQAIHKKSLNDLYVVILLSAANSIPKSTTSTPALELRRRFLALPS